MNLLTAYANYCGVKVKNPPYYPSSYFPLPESNYITLHNSSGGQSKNYSFFAEVVHFLQPILEPLGIEFVQIGGKDDKSVPHCFPYHGEATMRQSAFIVDHAVLHLGNDSVWCHYAGARGVPVVSPVSANPLGAVKPHFCLGGYKGIESHRNGHKPCFSAYDPERHIDLIKPEELANAVLELLNIPDRVTIKSLHLGKNFSDSFLEFVPDFMPRKEIFDGLLPDIRMDIVHDINILYYMLQFTKATITLNKPIPDNFLTGFKGRIVKIFYEVYDKAQVDSDFIKKLSNIGIPYSINCIGMDLNDVRDLRVEFFDYAPIHHVENKDFFSSDDEKPKKSSMFQSSKLLIGRHKTYPSRYHYEKDISINGLENEFLPVGDALDDKNFLRDKDFHYYYDPQ